VRLAPGTRLERQDHPGGEEILVLDGSFDDELGRYSKGTWLRNPPGSAHGAFSRPGCTLFVKTGHLARAA
jgi:anti-sigma factor ChrR (cupin superfamily)